MTWQRNPVFLFLIMVIALLSLCPFNNASADNCDRAKDIYLRGVNLMNYQERIKAFQKALELCPSYAEAYVNLGDAFENLGLLKKKFDPNNLKESNKLLDDAVAAYQKAIKLNARLYQHISDWLMYMQLPVGISWRQIITRRSWIFNQAMTKLKKG